MFFVQSSTKKTKQQDTFSYNYKINKQVTNGIGYNSNKKCSIHGAVCKILLHILELCITHKCLGKYSDH